MLKLREFETLRNLVSFVNKYHISTEGYFEIIVDKEASLPFKLLYKEDHHYGV